MLFFYCKDFLLTIKVELTEIIGFIAAVLTTVAFFPQVIKIWKTKSTKDISLIMFSTLVVGVALWLAYGLMINSMPIIVANIIGLISTSLILFFKLKYK